MNKWLTWIAGQPERGEPRKRLATVAAALVAFGVVQAVLSQPAAADGPGGLGAGARTVCLGTGAGGSPNACLALRVDGWGANGRIAGTGRAALAGAQDAAQIASFEIRLSVSTGHQDVADSFLVHSAGTPPNAVSVRTAMVPNPYNAQCAVRYHSVLHYVVRLTNGSLPQGSYTGPWFDSPYAKCAGTLFGPAARSRTCLGTVTGGLSGGCIDLVAVTVLSNDGTVIYGRGSIAVDERAPGADLISRVQVDNVIAYPPLGGGKGSPRVNSGNTRPRSAESQTPVGLHRLFVCDPPTTTWWSRAVLHYSARMADGTLRTGTLNSPRLNLPC